MILAETECLKSVSSLFHCDNQDHIFEFHFHPRGEQLYLSLGSQLQMLNQEKFGSHTSTDGLSL